ncbi:ROK family protein [Mycoplasma marinum]|uniref:ROK family protein n=1 Tax=Mycoplasma marinum TaxID=1937190 RepID=A0A4R0XUR3_9MOLU|nr:ROK family protein [Mycoplasma marinum]TCG11547.1 hypothetical protein C4B24_01720 [Mycoplasma marinum]
MKILAFDIGGTGVQYCLFESKNKEYSKIKTFTTRDITKKILMIRLSEIINKIKPDIISVSSPGAIINNEYVSGLTGIKGYSNFNFVAELKNLLENKEVKIRVLNDANAALMSEINESNSHLDIALISIGTGIGGAIAFKGRIRNGKRGMAGEFGYQIVDDEKNVSLASSSRSIETAFQKEFNESKTAKEIETLYMKDPRCKKVFDASIKQNAINIFNLYYILDIDLFIISGGISHSKLFINKIKASVKTLVKTRGAGEPINIKIATHQNNSGVVGAINFILKEI